MIINEQDLRRVAAEIVSFIETKVLEEAGTLEVSQIQKRTSKGIKADGEAMKPYAESYIPVRRHAGLGVRPPNLYFTGKMRNSLRYFKGGRYVSVSSSQEDKAGWNQETRMWIGANVETDIPLLEKQSAKLITEKFGK